MSWLKLNIQTTQDYAEQIQTFLSLFGAIAVTYEDAQDEPLFEPLPSTTPLWQQVCVASLFAADIDSNQIINFLRSQLGEQAIQNHHITWLEDQDWERAWLEGFQPKRFGERLWVCPSVYDPPQPDAINIILDPGLAFGTGTHPTTALCLEWLDAHPPEQQTVIDYGCGSGILAIAAIKLGAQQVWAVDHDPLALEATQENATRNNIDPTKLKICSPADLPALQADILLANILANILIELAPNIASLVKPQGKCLLSGILIDQAKPVMQAYQNSFLVDTTPYIREDWIALEFTRK